MLTVDFDRVRIERGTMLLDVGCGGGRHAYAAVRRGADVVALDADSGECTTVLGTLAAMRGAGEISCQTVSEVVCGDASRLPFADRSFDVVVASEVLEHVRDDAEVLAELARVLRPGGTFVVTVPRWWPETVNWLLSREYHEVEGGHVRIYRRRQLCQRVEKAGMTSRERHYAHALHTPYWWLRCLVGVSREDHPLVSAYHRFLVWDIVRAPRVTRWLERLLRPLLGKSLVVYFERSEPPGRSA
jgi:SAM-dependent methyltransferase